MKRARACAVWMGLMSVCALAGAADSERARIKAERATAVAKFDAQERECQARFFVTLCVDAAREEQRATLTRLRREEILLDETKRRDAAVARSQSDRDKAEAQAAKASEAAKSDEGKGGVRKPPRPSSPNPPRDGASKPAVGGASAPADKRLTEQQNEAKFEERARAAQAHREAVELRNAERAAQGKVAKPLPAPGGASVP